MKICPTCRRTYEDDGLNFCLEDGSVLTFTAPEAAPTVVMETPRQTNARPEVTGTQPGWNNPNAPGDSMQPRPKSSKAWLWVVGIFALLALVCGGGFVGFFVYVASVANNANIASNKSTNTSNASAKTNSNSRPSPSPSPSTTGDAEEIELAGWVEEPTEFLETSFNDGEFFMTSRKTGYYYVLVAKDENVSNAKTARVTVRNPDDDEAGMGYGLVFNSEMTPLTNDYAFLIDTKRKKFRVVRHESSQEKTITGWTASNHIKPGTEANLLEARSTGDKIDLYINGQLANSVTNKQGPKSGVPGLYVGDGAKIGFRKLEVVK